MQTLFVESELKQTLASLTYHYHGRIEVVRTYIIFTIATSYNTTPSSEYDLHLNERRVL